MLSFIRSGLSVVGLEVDGKRLDDLRRGGVGLAADSAVLLEALREAALILTLDAACLEAADSVVVCVPTPVDRFQTPDLTALQAACAAVVKYAHKGQTIVLTSTTYVGCTRDLLVEPLRRRGFKVGEDLHVAFSPERINPGGVEHSPEGTPRVLGGYTAECAVQAGEFLTATCSWLHIVSSLESAEMTKLLENTFRAVNIAFINEMAEAANVLAVDIGEVIAAAATKPYGFMRFTPSAGVGGQCIPVDPHYLLWQLRGRRSSMPILEASMTGIAARSRVVCRRAEQVLAHRGRALASCHVHVWGATYKPGVADVRESPAVLVMEALHEAGAQVTFSDPMVDSVVVAGALVPVSAPDTAREADLVVVTTLHPGQDWAVFDHVAAVLDTTYKLPRSGRIEAL